MDWACPDCDRRYDDPPNECVCGGQPVPEGTPDSTDRLSRIADNAYRAVFDPDSLDRNLLAGGTYVRIAFRLVVLASTLLLLLILAGIVLNALF